MYKQRTVGGSVTVRGERRSEAVDPAPAGNRGQFDSVGMSLGNNLPIFVIESNALLREGLSSLFGQSKFTVIGSGATLDVIHSSIKETPEIIIIGADNAAGIANILDQCRARYPKARRIVLHECSGDNLVQILKAGAHACLGQSATSDALLMTLDLAMQGVTVVSSPLGLIGSEQASMPKEPEADEQNGQSHPAAVEASHKLSMREIAILGCLVHGDSNKLIARKFQIAEATVKVHVKAILRKIRAANRTQAAIWAIHNLSTAQSHANM